MSGYFLIFFLSPDEPELIVTKKWKPQYGTEHYYHTLIYIMMVIYQTGLFTEANFTWTSYLVSCLGSFVVGINSKLTSVCITLFFHLCSWYEKLWCLFKDMKFFHFFLLKFDTFAEEKSSLWCLFSMQYVTRIPLKSLAVSVYGVYIYLGVNFTSFIEGAGCNLKQDYVHFFSLFKFVYISMYSYFYGESSLIKDIWSVLT